MILATNFCQETQSAWKIVGTLLLVVKIVVPLIVTITGVVPFVTAVTSGKAEDLFASFKKLIFKLIAALIVFMIPTIIPTVINILVGDSGNADTAICTACIKSPTGGECGSSDPYSSEEIDSDTDPIGGNLDTGELNNGSNTTSDDDDDDE